MYVLTSLLQAQFPLLCIWMTELVIMVYTSPQAGMVVMISLLPIL